MTLVVLKISKRARWRLGADEGVGEPAGLHFVAALGLLSFRGALRLLAVHDGDGAADFVEAVFDRRLGADSAAADQCHEGCQDSFHEVLSSIEMSSRLILRASVLRSMPRMNAACV